jgi:hypothetical protein
MNVRLVLIATFPSLDLLPCAILAAHVHRASLQLKRGHGKLRRTAR